MKNLLIRLWKEEEGQDITEYALLLVLIALGSVAMVTAVGAKVNTIFTNANTALTTAT
jgi:pilus assembly protein Flp/PilA